MTLHTSDTQQRHFSATHPSCDVTCEPICADAILDRIVHDAYRLEPDGQRMGKTITKMDDDILQI